MLVSGRTQGDAEVLKIDFIKYNKTYIQEWVPSRRDPRHHLTDQADETSIYKLRPEPHYFRKIIPVITSFNPRPHLYLERGNTCIILNKAITLLKY